VEIEAQGKCENRVHARKMHLLDYRWRCRTVKMVDSIDRAGVADLPT
jgi:hypothetical protein